MPSEHELADQTGVSRLTVRKAYSELVKKGMLQTVQGKGTFVADSIEPELLSKGNLTSKLANRTIGLLFPEITEYFGRILKEIEQRASQDGYSINVMFNDSIERERQAIDQMLSQNPAGIILTPYRLKRSNVIIKNYEKLAQSGVPIVMIGRPPFHINCDATFVDDTVGIYDTVQTLIGMAHQEFVFLFDGVNSDPQGLMERSEGFKLAIQTVGSSKKPQLIDISEDSWQEKLRTLLLAENPVTAVITDADGTAAAAYTVILDCGKKIPADVSVVGYDNSSICESLQVKLASVAPNRKLLGRHAYDLLKTRINREPDHLNGQVTHSIIITPTLVIRESIGNKLSD